MVLASIIITIIYLLLIGGFVIGFDKATHFQLEDILAKTKFSIVIPFRNEVENIEELLSSLQHLQYPKHLFEIILVDDDSDDNSTELIQSFIDKNQLTEDVIHIKTIQNKRTTNSPKKDAITTAINHAKNNWILTTDADCSLPQYWLSSFDELIQKTDAKCIAAPVSFLSESSFLNQFQILDMLSLQGATIGGFGMNKPFLCNGANFAYKKQLFKQLNGFEGNTNIASGDDIFFLEKVMKHHPKHLFYLKNEHAIVKTKTQATWQDLIHQRVRWTAKTSAYNNTMGKLTGLIVLIMNGLIISTLTLSLLSVYSLKIFGYLIFIKLNIDFLLIYKSSVFFKQKSSLKSFLIAFLLYPFFSFYVAFLSVFKTYKWKNRSFKK